MVVNVSVRVGIGEEHSAIVLDVSERIEHVGELVGWDVLWKELSCINVPVAEVPYRSVSIVGVDVCGVRGLT